MTSFQLSLAIIGALAVLAVWIFNKLQERRVRKRVEGPFNKGSEDVLFGSTPSEPRFSSREEPVFTSDTAREPTLGEPPALESVVLDEDIHVLIPIALEQELSGERLLSAFQGFRHAGKQNVVVLGAMGPHWVPIQPGARFEGVLVAVQLANRTGAINEIEYSEFVAALEQAVQQLPGTCDVPEMVTTIARARALDSRCAPLDAQIGVNLANPEGSWLGTLIEEVARDHDLVLRSDGRFHALDAAGGSVFALQNAQGPAFRQDTLAQTEVTRLTLVLDVPCADPSLRPFAQMTVAAQTIGERLHAVLVDDALRTLTPNALGMIEGQVDEVYRRLAAEGMPAGSARALALFR